MWSPPWFRRGRPQYSLLNVVVLFLRLVVRVVVCLSLSLSLSLSLFFLTSYVAVQVALVGRFGGVRMSISCLVSLSFVVVSFLPGLGILARNGLRKQWAASIRCMCVGPLSVSM